MHRIIKAQEFRKKFYEIDAPNIKRVQESFLELINEEKEPDQRTYMKRYGIDREFEKLTQANQKMKSLWQEICTFEGKNHHKVISDIKKEIYVQRKEIQGLIRQYQLEHEERKAVNGLR